MSTESATTAPKWSSKKRIVLVSIAAILLMGVIPFGWIYIQMHGAKKALERFGDALIAQDYARAYGQTTDGFQTALSESAFTDMAKLLCAHHGALKSFVIGPSETEGSLGTWSATFSVRMVFEHAEEEFVFVLKKDDGVWRVNGYKEL